MNVKEAEQNALPPHETPAFKSTEVEPALKALKTLVGKLSKKPAPKKEKPAKDTNSTEETGGDGDEASPGEEKAEGGEEGEGVKEEGEGVPEGGDDPLREDEL